MGTNLCPNCGVGLRGELIFDVGMRFHPMNRERALEYAECFGATETEGWFKREIAIYDRDRDRTVAYRCPDCGHEWNRS